MRYWIGIPVVLTLSWLTFRVAVRRDYRETGSLSFLSAGLEFLVFGLHANLPYLYLPAPWPSLPPLPDSALQRVLGGAAIASGLLATLAVMAQLGCSTTVGGQPEQLRQTGPYGCSRNPQLLTYGLMLAGCAVLYPSWQAAAWLAVYGAIAQLMVLTEEEHLTRLFGSRYEDYCRRVPRYLLRRAKQGILGAKRED